jgi:predicted Fe-Mo cluster-binding NifX family protein
MKIAFPLLTEKDLAQDFAHSKLIGIFDISTSYMKLLPVGENLTDEKNIFDSLVQNELNMVISPFYSFMSLRVFKENGIKTFKALRGTIDDNINSYMSGKMKPFDIYESLLTGDCAKDCASCGPEKCES